MEQKNTSFDVMLNIPKQGQPEKAMTIEEFFRVLRGGWKTLAICIVVFSALGALFAYVSAGNTNVPGGTWTVQYEIFTPGLWDDGMPYDMNEIKRVSYVEEAMLASGLSQQEITAADILPRITVSSVLLPNSARILAIHEENNSNSTAIAEAKILAEYYPNRFTLTLRADGPLADSGDAPQEFLTQLLEVYSRELSNIPTAQNNITEKVAAIISEEDYPVALFEVTQVLKFFAATARLPEREQSDLIDLLERQIPVLRREIEANRPTRDRDGLLVRLNADMLVSEQQYLASAEEARLLSELISATRQTVYDAPDPNIVNRAQLAADNAAEAFSRQNYYGHLMEIYSLSDVNISSSNLTENMFSELLEFVSVFAHVSVSAFAPAEFSVPPREPDRMSRVAVIFAGMVFMGLFAGLIIVFGKRQYKNRLS